jgi:hypothetical protein
MMNDQDPNKSRSQDDLDVGSFLAVLTRAFSRLGQLIKSFFVALSELILIILLIIRKRFIWIGVGSLIGMGIGFYQYISKGPSYYSVLTAKTNYQSSRLLYNKISYYNSLIKNRRYPELVKNFGISNESARSLLYFEIEPIINDFEAAKVYRENFLNFKHTEQNESDTIWSRTMKFKEFREQMSIYDYPQHEITLYSQDADIFPKVQSGLIKAINNDPSLTYIKNERQRIQHEEDSLLAKSLHDLDTLRKAYNVKLTRGDASGSSDGNQLFLAEGTRKNPELEVYDKTLMIKDELVSLKQKRAEETDIISIQSAFNESGTPVSKFRESFTKYTLIGFCTVLAFFILLEIGKVISAVEQSRIKKQLQQR